MMTMITAITDKFVLRRPATNLAGQKSLQFEPDEESKIIKKKKA